MRLLITKLTTSLAALTLALSGMASTLTPEQALDRALTQRALTSPRQSIQSTDRSKADMSLVHTLSEAGKPTVYLFSSPDGGYLCAAASDASQHALLGFSDTGSIDPADMPPAMQWWLQGYSRQIAAAETDGNTTAGNETAADTRSPIAPLLTTSWAQTEPYNDLTPLYNGSHMPTGCVATALAQCMRHEQWPAKGRGNTSYKWTYGNQSQTLALDFDTITFDWDIMPDYFSSSSTAEMRSEVAKLLYSVGVAVHMNYNPSGSSGNYMTAVSALINYFDYAESACYYEREYFEFEEWTDKIYNELAKGRPVPYSGQSATEGHAFVCDGYDTNGYFHFNWGWNGSYDGYFLLNELNPAPEREGDPSKGWNAGQAIITGLTRSSSYEDPAIELRVTGDFTTSAQRYSRTANSNVTFRCTNGIFSMAYAKAVVTLGARITDSTGNTTYAESPTTHTFHRYSAIQTYNVPVAAFPATGTYEVTPVFKDSIGQWHEILFPVSAQRALSLRCTTSSLQFGESVNQPDLNVDDISLESPLYIGANFKLTAVISNDGEEFYEEVWPVLLRNDSIVAHGPGQFIDVPKGMEIDGLWVGKLTALSGKTLTPGIYELGLANSEDGSYKLLSHLTEVKVSNAPQAPLFYTASTVSINGIDGESTSASSPVSADGSEATMSFSVTCTQGYFDQTVYVYIYSADSEARTVTSSTGQFIGVGEGETRLVTGSVDLSSLSPGQTFMVYPYGSASGRLNATPAYLRITTTGIDGITADGGEGRVYPSPAIDVAHIDCEAEVKNVEAYSIAGSIVPLDWSADSGHVTMNVAPLARGLYIVRLTMTDGREVIARMLH